jgi:hypothetical protein
MGAPYTEQSASSYNANPPADDGSESTENQINWSTIKTKLSDPVKTLAEAIDDAVLAAFGKIIGGGSIASTAVDYTAGASDQGKQIVVTVAAKTVTTPDATAVLAPFLFGVFNASSGAITLDGSGSQTINGVATLTLAPGQGMIVFTDGTNWRAYGEVGTFVGKQMGYGQIINGTLVESNATNAVTFAVKTLAGADPSSSDPVLVCFRNATVATGNYVYRTITAALSLTISSGSTLGFASGVAARAWIVIFDDGGTLRLGAINCRSGTNVYPLGRNPIASSTAEGGAGAADSAQVFYTGTAVTSKPYVILGLATYESGVATAGAWNASPTSIQLFGPGIPLPGHELQRARTESAAVATGTTAIPYDDTIPQSGEGDEYLTRAITPVSAANILRASSVSWFSHSSGAVISALFRDATADALAVSFSNQSATLPGLHQIDYAVIAGSTSATTFKLRAGSNSGATTTFNGAASARLFGGTFTSHLQATEIMA